MKPQMMAALILFALVPFHAFSQETFEERISASVDLFDSDDGDVNARLSTSKTAMAEHSTRNARSIGYERASTATLLGGYSPGKRIPGRPYWTSDNLIRMKLFDREAVFLENLRIYEIKPGVIGWVGTVNDENGVQIGTAAFEIYADAQMHGHIRLPSGRKLEIEPSDSMGDYYVLEFTPDEVQAQFDKPDTRTIEQREFDVQEWRDTFDDPSFDQLRRNRDEQIEDATESENQ